MTGNGKHTSYKNGDDWGMVIIVLTTLLYFFVGFANVGKWGCNMCKDM